MTWASAQILALPIPPRGKRQAGALNLASNILLHPQLESLHEQAREMAGQGTMATYPDIQSSLSHFCELAELAPEEVICAAGSDELVKLIYLGLCPKGGFIQQFPSYGQWYAPLASAPITKWAFDEQKHLFDIAELLGLLKHRSECAVLLSNPNSPIGSSLTQNELDIILDIAHERNHIVVMDAAYEAFSNDKLQAHPAHSAHLLTIRTFSKAFGAPGLRFGYLHGDRDLISLLRKYNTAASISAHSWALTHALLSKRAEFAPIWSDICQARARLTNELLQRNIFALDSGGNFVSAFVGKQGQCEQLVDWLCSKNFLTRSAKGMFGISGYWRCTIPPLHYFDDFLAALDEMPASLIQKVA